MASTRSNGRPSRRRPPRSDVVTYRIVVELDDLAPRIWRELEVASDTRLDSLHAVLQIAMGWTDSHLHAFAVGEGWHHPQTERYAMAGDADEGFVDVEPDVPEAEVRLDELVQAVGDVLLYTYDFGDGWDHTVRLEAVLARPDGAAPPRCTAGGGSCPPEDCGGAPGYEELLAQAGDPSRLDPDERAELEARLDGYFPGVALPGIAHAATLFDASVVDTVLARPSLPGPLAELLDRAHGPGALVLAHLTARADPGGAVLIDADAAARMVEPFAWLVRHIGTAGLPLTAAGYLRPVDVAIVVRSLGIDDRWIRAASRESQTYPVLQHRQAAQKLGLLRIVKGRVVATRVGLKLANDPVGLWWHIAARLPVAGRQDEVDSGLVFLLAIAAAATDAEVEAVMPAIGWVLFDGSPMSAAEMRRGSGLTRAVLERLGVISRITPNKHANREGISLARAALRTWP